MAIMQEKQQKTLFEIEWSILEQSSNIWHSVLNEEDSISPESV